MLTTYEQELNVTALHFDDKTAELLARQASCLRNLDASWTKITGIGIKSLVLACRLQQLSIKGCCSVGLDAVEWARGQGIKVDFTHPESSRGKATKVR